MVPCRQVALSPGGSSITRQGSETVGDERFIYKPGGGTTAKGKRGNYQCTACGAWFVNESSVTLHWYWMRRKQDPKHTGSNQAAGPQTGDKADEWRRQHKCPRCGGSLGRLADISHPGTDVIKAMQVGAVYWCRACRYVFDGRLMDVD